MNGVINRIMNFIMHRKYVTMKYEPIRDYYRGEIDIPGPYKLYRHPLFIKDCPFEPSSDEVIYVENEYDEFTNRVILDNLNLIRECFAKRNLVFIYLPLLNRELKEDDRVLQYRRPYGEIEGTKDFISLKNNFLLDFMENQDARSRISPCFARFNYDDEEPCFDENRNMSFVKYYIYDTFSFNVNEAKDLSEYFDYISEKVSGKLDWWSGACCIGEPSYDDADEAFDAETATLLKEVRYKIGLLRGKGISDFILEKLVKSDPVLSRIIVTRDYRIFLPDYNNMEIKMEPLIKSVFLLFLKHPEGILFKALPDYRKELAIIYDKVRGKKTSNNMLGIRIYNKNIINVTDPLNNSINEKCTRIKEAFLLNFHESMAEYYFITGKRGEPKRIKLPENLIIWEE